MLKEQNISRSGMFEEFDIPQFDNNKDIKIEQLEEQGRRVDLKIQDILDRLEILERLVKE